MPRLYLIVEGQTEAFFSERLLRKHLLGFGVYLMGARLTAFSRRKGAVHRGGVCRYERVRNDIRRWLKQDRAQDAFFTTMLDVYGLPGDFPGLAQSTPDPYIRVAQLEQAFQQDMDDARFIAYLQLHEFEALLLSDPDGFSGYYPQQELRRGNQTLRDLVISHPNPELIDDGQCTAPSKRIGQCIPQYLKAKPIAGPAIAERIGLQTIRTKCPHFHDWIGKLEALGQR